MALYHFRVTQIKRSAGQSAIGSAAYRAGEKMYSEYYGEYSDYSDKHGVIFTEIVLPDYAPAEYQNRATLWNAVEKAEHRTDAQLAYSFDIALQNELTIEENITLARQFVREQFVAKGMIVDMAVHSPDKKDGIPNPHIHVMCPIRPLNPDGTWGKKQRRVYRLDENGNRIRDTKGRLVFDAVPLTDWGDTDTLLAWRTAWEELINAKFAEKGLDCRIDYRSNEERGIEAAPTVHEGPAVKQMEAKGIDTNKGELNRWITATNRLLSTLLRKLAGLRDWIRATREKLNQPKLPTLAQLLIAYYEKRNAMAWSGKGKIRNLQDFAKVVNFLTENDITSLEELENCVNAQDERVTALKASMKAKVSRVRELRDLLSADKAYRELKPLFDEQNAIKWKGKRKKCKEEHDRELRQFYAVRRILKEHSDPNGKYSTAAWIQEIVTLEHQRQAEYARYKELDENFKQLMNVRYCVEMALHQQEEEQRRTEEQNRAYYQQQQTQTHSETR